MTIEQAYAEGFCKAAEAAGVDPVALYKAAVDPAAAAGAAALLGGGALAGSAVTGDDQSMAKRVGKATLGTGLAVGGYKAMTDPKWQAGIRTGTQKAMDIIREMVGRMPAKAASARHVKSAGILDTLVADQNGRPGVLPRLLSNEHLRRAAVGALASGTTAALASDGKHRVRNALLAAGLGGLGTYGASASGALDNALTPFKPVNGVAAAAGRRMTAQEIARKLRKPNPSSPYERMRAAGSEFYSRPEVQQGMADAAQKILAS